MDPDPYWIRIGIGIQPKLLDPDPDEMNADPQPSSLVRGFSVLTSTSIINGTDVVILCSVISTGLKCMI